MAKSEDESKSTLFCSFCGKSQHEVRKLIAGPTVFICDECVELCMDIIREEHKSAVSKIISDGIPTCMKLTKFWMIMLSGKLKQSVFWQLRCITITSGWPMKARLASWKSRNLISCWLALQAVAKRCWHSRWHGCWMCLSRWQMRPL